MDPAFRCLHLRSRMDPVMEFTVNRPPGLGLMTPTQA